MDDSKTHGARPSGGARRSANPAGPLLGRPDEDEPVVVGEVLEVLRAWARERGCDRAEHAPVAGVEGGAVDLAAEHAELVADTMISRSFERPERTARRASAARNRNRMRCMRFKDRPA